MRAPLLGLFYVVDMTEHDYDAGVRDGRIEAIERMQVDQNKRLDEHSDRIRAQERVVYGLIGAIALIEVLPALRGMLL